MPFMKLEKAGYILLMNSKLVVFHYNNPAKTPSMEQIREALECVHGSVDQVEIVPKIYILFKNELFLMTKTRKRYTDTSV